MAKESESTWLGDLIDGLRALVGLNTGGGPSGSNSGPIVPLAAYDVVATRLPSDSTGAGVRYQSPSSRLQSGTTTNTSSSKWSAQRCIEYGQQIIRDEDSLAAFRKSQGGSYLDDSGLAAQKANNDFQSRYGQSIADYLSISVSAAGAASAIAGNAVSILEFLAGSQSSVGATLQTADVVLNGFSAVASSGLGANDASQSNTAGAVSNFAGAAGNITSLTLTGLQLGGSASNGALTVTSGVVGRVPIYGAILNLGQAAIFGYEQLNTLADRIMAAVEIDTHYKMQASAESGAVARLNASHALFDENCKSP